MAKLTILFFGWFDRHYARNRVLIEGLRAAGVELSYCQVRPGKFQLLRLFFKYLAGPKNWQVMLVAFPDKRPCC